MLLSSLITKANKNIFSLTVVGVGHSVRAQLTKNVMTA